MTTSLEYGLSPEQVPSDAEMDAALADLAEQVDEIFTPEVISEMPVMKEKATMTGDAGNPAFVQWPRD